MKSRGKTIVQMDSDSYHYPLNTYVSPGNAQFKINYYKEYKPTATATHGRWRLEMNQTVLIFVAIISMALFILLYEQNYTYDQETVGRDFAIDYINRNLEETLKFEKGQGCHIPRLDPFSEEITQFDAPVKKLNCKKDGEDWVRCYMSKCKVLSKFLRNKKVVCLYEDLIYHNDYAYSFNTPVLLKGSEEYNLTDSDHVRVTCAEERSYYIKHMGKLYPSWSNIVAGFRTNVPLAKPPKLREKGISVIIVGFDSVSKNMFIRKVPKSYNYLTREMDGIVLNGYNIVGDGSSEALFPLLSGKTSLELPESISIIHHSEHLKPEYFIFHHARQDGYRTLYFEDSPHVNTFQSRMKGFLTSPVDHYLRPFCLAYENKDNDFCVGDTPQYKMMLNLTYQFLQLSGKKFGFNFMVDISHEDFNMISLVDDDLLHFLRLFREEGHMKDTMLILMSDHGPRFFETRSTYQGRLEERLPLMALVLPEHLKHKRPGVKAKVEENAEVLTTPFDIYATMLDAMDLTQHWNMKRVKGADLPRSLSLFRPIPRNRTCSEAGIEVHFCSCFRWSIVSKTNPVYYRVANALVDHINRLTMDFRYRCQLRVLTSVEWVLKHIVNEALLSMQTSDRHFPVFLDPQEVPWELYQVRIKVSPGSSTFEGTVKYIKKLDKFVVNTKEISRTNPYGHEPDCIKKGHPDLEKYCYCYQ